MLSDILLEYQEQLEEKDRQLEELDRQLAETVKSLAREMLRLGNPPEATARATGLPIQEVEKLRLT